MFMLLICSYIWYISMSLNQTAKVQDDILIFSPYFHILHYTFVFFYFIFIWMIWYIKPHHITHQPSKENEANKPRAKSSQKYNFLSDENMSTIHPSYLWQFSDWILFIMSMNKILNLIYFFQTKRNDGKTAKIQKAKKRANGLSYSDFRATIIDWANVDIWIW